MPDYNLVVNHLLQIYNNYDMVQKLIPSSNSYVWELKKRSFPHSPDVQHLDNMMKQTRANDFQEYFNMQLHRSTQASNVRMNRAGIVDPAQ